MATLLYRILFQSGLIRSWHNSVDTRCYPITVDRYHGVSNGFNGIDLMADKFYISLGLSKDGKGIMSGVLMLVR